MENTDLLKSQLEINDAAAQHLYETAKWAKFLAIVGFVFCGLFVLFGIYFATTVSSLGYYNRAFSGLGPAVGILYIVLSLIFFFPFLFLMRFATKMKLALNSSDQETLTEAFNQHRRMYKYIGIIAIIIISIYALIIVFALAGVAMR